MSPSSSLLNDPSKLDFPERQILVMLHPSLSTLLAVLALVRHLLHHHTSENPYNREVLRKIKFSVFFFQATWHLVSMLYNLKGQLDPYYCCGTLLCI